MEIFSFQIHYLGVFFKEVITILGYKWIFDRYFGSFHRLRTVNSGDYQMELNFHQ